MNIKFIYFDVGGVLTNWSGSLLKLAAHHNVPHGDVLRIFQNYEMDFCRGIFTKEEARRKFNQALKLENIDEFDYNEFCISHFRIIEETHELARVLSKKYPIGLLTNLHTGSFDHLVARNQVPRIDYQSIVKSYEVGFVKPEKQIYEIAQKKSGVAHNEILFIDDLPQNIASAQSLGWHGHVFDEKNPKRSVKHLRKLLGV